MPPLRNPKHELFAQDLARGVSAAQAYVNAGFKENRHNASALARTSRILTRVEFLVAKVQHIEEVSTERAIKKL